MKSIPDGYACDADGKVVPIPDGWYADADGNLKEMSDFQKRSAAKHAARLADPDYIDPRDLWPLGGD